MDEQLDERLDSILSPNHYGFRIAHNTLHCLMVMLVELKESRNRGTNLGLFSLPFLKHLIAYITIY